MSALLTADDYLQFPQAAADFRIPYGEHALQFAELRVPRTPAPHPVIILIHGGCYREQYDLRPVSGVAAALSEMGFAVWNIEYRRHGCGGAFPEMFLDAAAAADHLRVIAAERGLDLGRVISVGHSAGGHLALWLAGRGRIASSSPLYCAHPLPIHGVLALAPLADIALAWRMGACDKALEFVMGGSPDEAPEHYRAASPIELLPLGVPQRIVVGEQDGDVLRNASAFLNAAQRIGDEARMTTVPEHGHFEVVSVGTAAWSVVCHALAQIAARSR